MTRKSKYTKELLSPIIKRNQTWTAVLHELGLKVSGGNFRHIQGRVRILGISWDHFTGQSWAKGLTKETDERVARMAIAQRRSDCEVFVNNSSYPTHRLATRLLKLGWKYECAICYLSKWLGQKITLQVDHINGIATDHELENLRFLCPNCHSQTKTFGANKR